MKIEARFNFKAPETVENAEAFTITRGGMTIELRPDPRGGFTIALNAPFGDTLIVAPHANNKIAIHAGRVEDLKETK